MSKDEHFDKINEIVLSTGNVNRKYIVRDIIFCATEADASLFTTGGNLNDLLAPVKENLKTQAANYGADAVINCHFEYHRHQDKVDILAYGTVVQFTPSTIG